jgi:hypothetical protein
MAALVGTLSADLTFQQTTERMHFYGRDATGSPYDSTANGIVLIDAGIAIPAAADYIVATSYEERNVWADTSETFGMWTWDNVAPGIYDLWDTVGADAQLDYPEHFRAGDKTAPAGYVANQAAYGDTSIPSTAFKDSSLVLRMVPTRFFPGNRLQLLSITGALIENETIDASTKLSDYSIPAAKIDTGAVGNLQLATNAIQAGTGKVASSAIAASQIIKSDDFAWTGDHTWSSAAFPRFGKAQWPTGTPAFYTLAVSGVDTTMRAGAWWVDDAGAAGYFEFIDCVVDSVTFTLSGASGPAAGTDFWFVVIKFQ